MSDLITSEPPSSNAVSPSQGRWRASMPVVLGAMIGFLLSPLVVYLDVHYGRPVSEDGTPLGPWEGTCQVIALAGTVQYPLDPNYALDWRGAVLELLPRPIFALLGAALAWALMCLIPRPRREASKPAALRPTGTILAWLNLLLCGVSVWAYLLGCGGPYPAMVLFAGIALPLNLIAGLARLIGKDPRAAARLNLGLTIVAIALALLSYGAVQYAIHHRPPDSWGFEGYALIFVTFPALLAACMYFGLFLYFHREARLA